MAGDPSIVTPYFAGTITLNATPSTAENLWALITAVTRAVNLPGGVSLLNIRAGAGNTDNVYVGDSAVSLTDNAYLLSPLDNDRKTTWFPGAGIPLSRIWVFSPMASAKIHVEVIP